LDTDVAIVLLAERSTKFSAMVRSLIIDNYDSFTFNLYQLLGQVNGEAPIVIRNDELDWRELQQLRFDNIVISPGPGRPDRSEDFGVCADAIRYADVPVLGVCLGHQGIGLLHGAEVTYAPEPMHGRLSSIHHSGTGIFENLPSPFSAVRYHSLIVEAALPQCLEKLAWTHDGLVMALRHRHRPLWGVQFHPESICTEHGLKLLANFKAITERHAPARGTPAVSGSALEVDSNETPCPSPRVGDARFSLRVRKLAFLPDSEAVFMGLFRDVPAAFWLDSSLPAPGLARFSFMGDTRGPNSQLISYDTQSSTVTVDSHSRTTSYNESIFTFLSRELGLRQMTNAELPFAFNCGFIGYFGYELKRECDAATSHHSPLPDARFIFADRIIAFDHQQRHTYLLCLEDLGAPSQAQRWFDQVEDAIGSVSPPPQPRLAAESPPIGVRWRHSPDAYLNLIADCKRELAEGESYELCLTNQMSAEAHPDPLATYRLLRRLNPAPYAAFLRFNELAILSSSCERFLSVGTDRIAESKPVKGTAPRGRDRGEDRALRENLESSEKNRAENLMIVDLVRNDLGRVCEIGSVEVPRLMAVESYATVHQMVSTIRGRLRPGVTALDCVRAAFPAGSMTGAPKRRAMEILDRLEGAARGVYSGAIGYLGLDGSADLSVVIRTIVMTPDEVSFGTGGAIVALSDPAEELEEIRLKAKALIAAISASCNQPRITGK
jgi:para-aminobenzoate synthetase